MFRVSIIISLLFFLHFFPPPEFRDGAFHSSASLPCSPRGSSNGYRSPPFLPYSQNPRKSQQSLSGRAGSREPHPDKIPEAASQGLVPAGVSGASWMLLRDQAGSILPHFFLGMAFLGLNSHQTLGFIFGSHPSFHLNRESFPAVLFRLTYVDFHSPRIQIRVGFRDLQSFFPPRFPLICPCSTHPSSQQDSLWIFLPPAGFVWELLFPALILIPPSSHLIPGIPCSFPSIRWNIPSSGIQLESRRTPGKPPGKQQEGLKKTWNDAGSNPS